MPKIERDRLQIHGSRAKAFQSSFRQHRTDVKSPPPLAHAHTRTRTPRRGEGAGDRSPGASASSPRRPLLGGRGAAAPVPGAQKALVGAAAARWGRAEEWSCRILALRSPQDYKELRATSQTQARVTPNSQPPSRPTVQNNPLDS